MPEFRNRIAMNPLLRKGGAHEKSRSGQRQQNRTQLESMLDEWRELQQDEAIASANVSDCDDVEDD